MGVLVMVIGQSGSGKSTSLRNFGEGEVAIFNVAGKPLPFRKRLPTANRASYDVITTKLQKNSRHAYVIDDSTYLMQFDAFKYAKVKGYDKFVDMAQDFEKLLEVAMATDSNTIVYFLHHPQFGDDGAAKPQTIGKMLDNQLNIEGLFPIVIECRVVDGEHVFITKNDGTNIAKAPMGMLPDKMENDLKAVDTAIREYWQLEGLSNVQAKPSTNLKESR